MLWKFYERTIAISFINIRSIVISEITKSFSLNGQLKQSCGISIPLIITDIYSLLKLFTRFLVQILTNKSRRFATGIIMFAIHMNAPCSEIFAALTFTMYVFKYHLYFSSLNIIYPLYLHYFCFKIFKKFFNAYYFATVTSSNPQSVTLITLFLSSSLTTLSKAR